MNDPIVDEIRRLRDEHAARFNYDLDAIFQDIKDMQEKSGRKYVSYPPRRIEPTAPIAAAPPAVPPAAQTPASS